MRRPSPPGQHGEFPPSMRSSGWVLPSRRLLLRFSLSAALLGGVYFALQTSLAPVQADDEKSLAEELPRLPAVPADKALETFHLEHGFQLEQVAAEPLIGDPVDACFDENGRMYVAEFHAYPYAKEKEKIIPAGTERTESGIIRLLEDVDGDGVYEKSTVFADKLDWPLSVCVYDGGVFVIDPPDVYYLKDTDGDGKADIRETVYSHLNRRNVQGLANNLKWGLDNRIWVASGSNGGQIYRNGKDLLDLGRSDWVFDPKTNTVERASGGIQFGHSMDDWGNRFLCSNSVHIMHVVFDEKYLARNPYLPTPRTVRSIAREGGAAPVFRRSPIEPWRIVRTRRRVADPKYKNLPESERVPGGFFTSAAGVTIYRGSAYPEEFRGNAFVGDVGGNLVHRKTLHPQGATFEAVRADQNTEFIASTDTWFRPVNYVNAPDGTLYILDMYRETIEHPISIPEDIRSHLDLESGNNRGRIYRLVSPGMKRVVPPKLGQVALPELVENLASPNSWNRETAQRLLWERQEKAAIPLIGKLLETTTLPQGRLHALYTLKGLNALTAAQVRKALHDDHPGVRQHAAILAEPFLANDTALADDVMSLVTDPEFRPQFQAALAISWMQGETALKALKLFAPQLGTDDDLHAAFLLSVGDRGEPLIAQLLKDPDFLKLRYASGLLAKIAGLVGARPEEAPAEKLLLTLSGSEVPETLRQGLLQSLGQGLLRRGTTLSRMISKLPAESPVRQQIQQLFEQASARARDETQPVAVRQRAVQLLALAPWSTSEETFTELLAPQLPQELLQSTVTALGLVQDQGVAELLLSSWRTLTPALRGPATDVLLGRRDRTLKLLDALEAGTIKRSEIDRTKYPLLLQNPREDIRKRATKILAGDLSSNRRQVVESYQNALELPTDLERGRQVFTQKCSICHKLGNVGHQVGPDLTSVQNKIPADLLVAILDPNREAQQSYLSYTVSTLDGQIYSGMIASESTGSLTLRRAEGKEDVILRGQIDQFTSSGLSLMPEGLEKEITPQQVADVIAFIKSLKAPETPMKN